MAAFRRRWRESVDFRAAAIAFGGQRRWRRGQRVDSQTLDTVRFGDAFNRLFQQRPVAVPDADRAAQGEDAVDYR